MQAREGVQASCIHIGLLIKCLDDITMKEKQMMFVSIVKYI